MSLIKCPECEHEVSDSAITCPNCGFALKKEITTQKRVSFFNKYKGLIICIAVIGSIAGFGYYKQASRPQMYIQDFMADYNVSRNDWELCFGESSGSYGVYTWDNVQLIEGINGELKVVTYSPELKYWSWDVIGDEKTLVFIKRGLSRLTSDVSQWTLDGYDECYKYKWIEFREENTGIGDWTKGDELVTMEMVEGDFHQLLLLKKGNKIELQYVPINSDSSWNTNYYDID